MRYTIDILICSCLLLLLAGCASQAPQRMEESADYHVQLAGGHWEAGEAPQAIEELQVALQIDPNNEQAHYFLGFIFSGRRMFPQSIQHYRQALLLNPEWYEVSNNLGVVYLQLERWEEAEALFQSLTEVAHYSTPGHAYNNLGWSQLNQGRVRDALSNFEMATYLEPDMCLAYNNQGLSFEQLERSREAMDAYQQAINRCDDYAEPRFRMGRLLQREGRFNESASLFAECVEMTGIGSSLGARCREYYAELR